MRLGIASSFLVHAGAIGWLFCTSASLAVSQTSSGEPASGDITVAFAPEEAPPSVMETDAPLPSPTPSQEPVEPSAPAVAQEPATPTLASLPAGPPPDDVASVDAPPVPVPQAEPEPVRKPVREIVPTKPVEKPKRVAKPRRSPAPPVNTAPSSRVVADASPSPAVSSSPDAVAAASGSDGEKLQKPNLSSGDSTPAPAYLSKLRAQLEKHKVYPRDAKKRRIEGEARLRFTIDAGGNVLRHDIERSTGSVVLDEAIERMIADASPLPKLPPEIESLQLTLVVPISFTLE